MPENVEPLPSPARTSPVLSTGVPHQTSHEALMPLAVYRPNRPAPWSRLLDCDLLIVKVLEEDWQL